MPGRKLYLQVRRPVIKKFLYAEKNTVCLGGFVPSVPIQFYLPLRENNARERLPKSITDYWAWQCRTVPKNHFLGQYHWVLQTYLFLRESGLDCEYVTAFPAAGIVVTHREHLKETSYKPNRRLTIVCLQVDRPTFPFAQFHVVHSKMQEDKRGRKD